MSSKFRLLCNFAIALLLCLCAHPLIAAPLAGDGLFVSDTSGWQGNPSEGEGAFGVSTHPWFRWTYRCSAPKHDAAEVRIQVAEDPEFASMVWDSGFMATASTGADQQIKGVQYGGTPLQNGTTYFWRVAAKDDQQVAGPFNTEAASFTVVADLQAADLRVGSNAADLFQGNPSVVYTAYPFFSAELSSEELGADCFTQIELSYTEDFQNVVFSSDWIVTTIQEDGRSAPVLPILPSQGEGNFVPLPGEVYFWRMRFASDPALPFQWSVSPASFVYEETPPQVASFGGFAADSAGIGGSGNFDCHVVAGNLNGDLAPDVVLLSAGAGLSHQAYFNSSSGSFGAPVSFGVSQGMTTRGVIADFNWDGFQDVAVVTADSIEYFSYVEPGRLELTFALSISLGGPISRLEVADINRDGWSDMVLATGQSLWWCPNIDGEFSEPVLVANYAEIQDASVAYLLQGEQPEIIVLADGGLSLYRYNKESENDSSLTLITTWGMPGMARFVVPHNKAEYQAYFTDGTTASLWRLDEDWSWGQVSSIALSHTVSPQFMESADFNSDGVADLVIAGSAATQVVLRLPGDLLVASEYIGSVGDGCTGVIAVSDVDLDSRPDMLRLRTGIQHELHLNRPRLAVNISDASAVQQVYGSAYLEFRLELSQVPTSMVEITCEAGVQPPGESGQGSEDGDALPDPADWIRTQAQLPFIPITATILFVPGQRTALFRVPLTTVSAGAQYSLQATIISAIGASTGIDSATGTIFGVPAGGGARAFS